MSIFQDFENAKKEIGLKKYNAIETYLNNITNKENLEAYFKQLSTICSLPINKLNETMETLKVKYGVVLLDDVLYKKNEWHKFNNWYNETYLNRNVEVTAIWDSDYDDLRCIAFLSENNIEKANIIASYDSKEFDNLEYSETNKFIFKSLIYDDFDSYLQLPKISSCSSLLQEIYDNVCESDATMCHITEEDWQEIYADRYTDKDIEKLKSEVKKYELDDVITFDDTGYKIVGWGDLETRFNDDRNLNNKNEFEY